MGNYGFNIINSNLKELKKMDAKIHKHEIECTNLRQMLTVCVCQGSVEVRVRVQLALSYKMGFFKYLAATQLTIEQEKLKKLYSIST